MVEFTSVVFLFFFLLHITPLFYTDLEKRYFYYSYAQMSTGPKCWAKQFEHDSEVRHSERHTWT